MTLFQNICPVCEGRNKTCRTCEGVGTISDQMLAFVTRAKETFNYADQKNRRNSRSNIKLIQ